MSDNLLDDPSIDWSTCTYEGARLQNHRLFSVLPFSRKLEVVEEMNSIALRFISDRKRAGLPYRDPYTKQLVPGS